jgi:phosphoglycerol transferase MdoB-like AlkP superfamily enzyme
MKLSFGESFGLSISLLKKLLLIQLGFLLLLSLFRLLFYFEFSGNDSYIFSELLDAFFVGLRVDLVVIAYIQAPLNLAIIVLYFFRSYKAFKVLKSFSYFYILFMYLLASIFIAMDFGYFSFFNEHITLMIYGIMDDDTAALWRTMQDNYNIYAIFFAAIVYIYSVNLFIKKLLQKDIKLKDIKSKLPLHVAVFILIVAINALFARGSLGMFPLSRTIPDVSVNKFVNELPNNGVLAFIKATKLYKKSKSGKYNLIKKTIYKGKINEAFAYLSQRDVKKDDDYIKAITYKTPKNEKLEKLQANVVVVMVESGGLPIVKYQSEQFDILGRLKKHFEKDILFTNFISTSNGTIVSLEPLLLNITARPNSTSLGQSKYQHTSFYTAAAKVYEKAGYETHFIYGGDLKWRNVGKFMSKQGFKYQEGNIDITNALDVNINQVSHDWGVFDQYAYDYVLKLLKDSDKPQFIFLLTTNNHPPFKIPKDYKSNPLIPNEELKSKMIGDKELIQKRLFDYQYAFDMAGRFMDKVKNSKLADNTIVTITADNNTIEGRIRYEDQLNTSKKIPFYLYLPNELKPLHVDTKVASSHKDIFPTLYNLSLSSVEFCAVGKDLLDGTQRHCGFNDSGIIISKDGAFKHNKAITDAQKECNMEYDAALAVSDWLIRLNPLNTK